MVALGLWHKQDIDRIEAAQYRKILGCNNTITNKAILNTMTSIRLAGEAIMQLPGGAIKEFKRQHTIDKFFDKS